MHSYSNHLRHRLKGDIEVIEIAPPGVQTGLTPGQEDMDGYMPLDDYVAEVMANFEADPDLRENLVEMVKPFRHAECDGKLDQMLDFLVKRAKEQGEAG